jgi:small subunit ribosomal protein S20
MANIKSAKKRIKVIEKRTLRNKMIKSKTKTAIKKFLALVDSEDKAARAQALIIAVKTIDKAVAKGVYHKNTGARKKSRLDKLANKSA